jgi:hypothetical protein
VSAVTNFLRSARSSALKVLIEEGMVENAHAMGARFLAGLAQIHSPAVKEVRRSRPDDRDRAHPQAGGVPGATATLYVCAASYVRTLTTTPSVSVLLW